MKKNNRWKLFPAACIVLSSALIFSLKAEENPPEGKSKVRIQILSKHIRLLKEGKTAPLYISLPNGGEIDTGSRRLPCSTLSIISSGNTLTMKTDGGHTLYGSFTIYPVNGTGNFTIELNGEKRYYPLPLTFKSSGEEAGFSVEEAINRYAADSAWGELGNTGEKKSEALYALAHLIKARCALPYITGKHRGYHFCDLTCCQTYRGISGIKFNDAVVINTAGVKNGFFFNTSGGGKIFTEAIFNNRGKTAKAPEDIIYLENFRLSMEQYPDWRASINEQELASILYPQKKINLKNILLDMEKEIVYVENSNGVENFSPESFRIAVNRVKGWAFVKSNNYTVTKRDGLYSFRGSGLGHGAGMSFEGALQLAERGYSRYEILEHYYPEITYNTGEHIAGSRLQYIIFDAETGDTVKSSVSSSFRNRIIPCGSIFKLFIALYLAEKRKDLFYNYFYTCRDTEYDRSVPQKCWDTAGHGKMNIRSALYHSCNKYFASLHNKIDPDDFRNWIRSFNSEHGIEMALPDYNKGNGFSHLLAGLNFNLTITVNGIIKLNRYIYLSSMENTSEEAGIIFDSLHKTFSTGTASVNGNTSDEQHFYTAAQLSTRNKLWGKTGTVIAGTNSHHGYGIFTGGLNSRCIVAILRKGTGAMAARESGKILLNTE